jgi:hypothetical protein
MDDSMQALKAVNTGATIARMYVEKAALSVLIEETARGSRLGDRKATARSAGIR